MPAFQYETVRGDAPVTRLTASFDKLYVRDNRRTSELSAGSGRSFDAEEWLVPFLPAFLSGVVAALLLIPDFFASFICISLHAILQVSCQELFQFFFSEQLHRLSGAQAIPKHDEVAAVLHPHGRRDERTHAVLSPRAS